jgi:hypothetical protein
MSILIDKDGILEIDKLFLEIEVTKTLKEIEYQMSCLRLNLKSIEERISKLESKTLPYA